ncbi:MAG: hypothetical protein Q7L07_11115, partial [Pseudohongiella sp.]|nr:hypothetical protein [Pseudohongiella sp.]
ISMDRQSTSENCWNNCQPTLDNQDFSQFAPSSLCQIPVIVLENCRMQSCMRQKFAAGSVVAIK